MVAFLGMCVVFQTLGLSSTPLTLSAVVLTKSQWYITSEANWTSAITSHIAFGWTGRLISLANAQTHPFDSSV